MVSDGRPGAIGVCSPRYSRVYGTINVIIMACVAEKLVVKARKTCEKQNSVEQLEKLGRTLNSLRWATLNTINAIAKVVSEHMITFALRDLLAQVGNESYLWCPPAEDNDDTQIEYEALPEVSSIRLNPEH